MFNENEFLRKLRQEKGYMVKDVALSIGMTSSYVSQVEKGKKPIPRKRILGKWVESLGISTKYYEELVSIEKRNNEKKNKKRSYKKELKSIMGQGWQVFKGKISKPEPEMESFKIFLEAIIETKKYKETLINELCYIRFFAFRELEERFYTSSIRELVWKKLIPQLDELTSLFESRRQNARINDATEIESYLITMSYSLKMIHRRIFLDLDQTFIQGNEVLDITQVPKLDVIMELNKNRSSAPTKSPRKKDHIPYKYMSGTEEELEPLPQIIEHEFSRWTIAVYIWLLKAVLKSNRIIGKGKRATADSESEVVSKIIYNDFVEVEILNTSGAITDRFEYMDNKLRKHAAAKKEIEIYLTKAKNYAEKLLKV